MLGKIKKIINKKLIAFGAWFVALLKTASSNKPKSNHTQNDTRQSPDTNLSKVPHNKERHTIDKEPDTGATAIELRQSPNAKLPKVPHNKERHTIIYKDPVTGATAMELRQSPNAKLPKVPHNNQRHTIIYKDPVTGATAMESNRNNTRKPWTQRREISKESTKISKG